MQLLMELFQELLEENLIDSNFSFKDRGKRKFLSLYIVFIINALLLYFIVNALITYENSILKKISPLMVIPFLSFIYLGIIIYYFNKKNYNYILTYYSLRFHILISLSITILILHYIALFTLYKEVKPSTNLVVFFFTFFIFLYLYIKFSKSSMDRMIYFLYLEENKINIDILLFPFCKKIKNLKISDICLKQTIQSM